MSSFNRLCELTAETRANWATAERSLPRYAMHQRYKYETWEHIETHLETIAAMGIDKVTLTLDFKSAVGLAFRDFFVVPLPGELWEWWNAIELQIRSKPPNKDPVYLEHCERIRETRKRFARDALHDVVTDWIEQSDIPVLVHAPEQEGTFEWTYTFDWSGSEKE